MKSLKLLVCVLACLLVTSIFVVLPDFSAQPAIDTTTMHVGTIGQPRNVDPSQAYDTASCELIQNVYDSMLEFGSESSNITVKEADFPSGIPAIPANDSVNVGTDVATLGQTTDVPGVCQLPTITITNTTHPYAWTFKVNTNLVFQPWQKPDGTWVIDENITWQDIVYYFQRFFVQDSHNSPELMLMGPALGCPNFDAYQSGSGPSLGNNEPLVAGWIEDWATGWTNLTGQYVQLSFETLPTGIWDILCQTWCCIPPMQWSIDHGCWNDTFSVSPYAMTDVPYNYTVGGFYSGWSGLWRRFPSDLFTPLDEHTARSMYSSSTAEPAMCGTGPYCFTYWNQATNEWRIDAFETGLGNEPPTSVGCVSHPWPGPYGSGDPAPTTVIETGVNDWPTRKTDFLAGDFDMLTNMPVTSYNMTDLLASINNAYLTIAGVTLYYNILTLETEAVFFTCDVTAGSAYMPTVNDAADPTFFNNTLVRQAFCQCINSSVYISGAFYGEALQPSTFWCAGLTPTNAYLNATQLPPWNINLTAVYDDLQAAGIYSFSITLMYNTGDVQRMIACNEYEEAFNEINSLYDTDYDITVSSVNYQTYLTACSNSNLPIFMLGWLADFSDADDFIVPFMETGGTFTTWQQFSNSTIDNLIHQEEVLSAAPVNFTAGSPYMQRSAIMEQLQIDYIQNAISLPTDQPLARHWQRDWVYGYYVNQMYPGNYYQDLYKKAGSLLPPSSTSVTFSSASVALGSFVNCTAIVSGSSPTGMVTWTTSSNTGYFSQSVCTLSSGTCSTTYTDNSTGYVTITATYSGDTNNSPSSGTATLTVCAYTPASIPQPDAYIIVDPALSSFPPPSMTVGSTFSINVSLVNITMVADVQFALTWNSSLLNCTGMTEVLFHTWTPSADWSNIWSLEFSYNNAGGYANYSQTWTSFLEAESDGSAPGNVTVQNFPATNGEYPCCTFTFEVLQLPTMAEGNLTCLFQFTTVRVATDWPSVGAIIDTTTSTGNPPIPGTYIIKMFSSSTTVVCSSNTVPVGSSVICTATVSGSSPMGTVSWSTSSSAGSFNPSVSTLSSGSCSTMYTDTNTGYVTITATYSGDSNTSSSSGTATLTVFVNVTTGTNVTVTPTSNLGLTFVNVTTAGTVVANETPTVLAPPMDLVGEYYVITVTASFAGNVTVSIAFNGSNMTEEQKSSLQMMQYTPIPGDINGDGTVDIYDALLLSAAYGATPGASNWNSLAKLTDPAVTGPDINIYDAIVLSSNYGQTATWINITLYVNTTTNTIYGQTTHFSYTDKSYIGIT
jgi:ABC-type oligopeptide transport system substrate-binding subunit